MKRTCAYCGEKILGYPHVTVWDEQPKDSHGLRFHTIEEAVLYFAGELGWTVLKGDEKLKCLQDKLQRVLGVISDMERLSGAVKDEDLFDELKKIYGISRVEATKLVGILVRDGTIYSPRLGCYRRVA